MSNSSLVNIKVPAHSGNYSNASYRVKIDKIVIHHMAGVMTAQACGNVFATKGRGGSAHYGIGSDGKIGLYVDESCVAWHAGDWKTNQRSVGIELSNSSTGGNWPVSDTTLDLAARLVADIAKRNGLGTLVCGQNLGWHSLYAATQCPGDYVRSKMQEICNKANAINGGTPMSDYDKSYADGFLPAPNGYWAIGDDSSHIATLAEWMRSHFPSYTPEGALGSYYGQNISGAIREFQRRVGIEADGCVGPITYAKLKEYGFNYDLDSNSVKKPEPVVEPTPEPQPEPTPEPTPEPEAPKKEDPTVGILQKIIDFIKHIIDLITEKK